MAQLGELGNLARPPIMAAARIELMDLPGKILARLLEITTSLQIPNRSVGQHGEIASHELRLAHLQTDISHSITVADCVSGDVQAEKRFSLAGPAA